MRIGFALATALALLGPAPALAQGLTGERLHQICGDRGSDQWREIGQWLCPSYVRGIIDGARLQAMRDAGGSLRDHRRLLAICDPPSATGDEALAIVMRFLETRPEARPLPAAVAVFEALAAAWPCER